jgi:hypothetical protein
MEAAVEAAVEAAAEKAEAAPAAPQMMMHPANFFYFNQKLPGSLAPKAVAPKMVYHPYYGFIPGIDFMNLRLGQKLFGQIFTIKFWTKFHFIRLSDYFGQ